MHTILNFKHRIFLNEKYGHFQCMKCRIVYKIKKNDVFKRIFWKLLKQLNTKRGAIVHIQTERNTCQAKLNVGTNSTKLNICIEFTQRFFCMELFLLVNTIRMMIKFSYLLIFFSDIIKMSQFFVIQSFFVRMVWFMVSRKFLLNLRRTFGKSLQKIFNNAVKITPKLKI